MSHDRQISQMLSRVVLDGKPFFAALVMRMDVRWATEKDHGCDTAYTDGRSIVMNKEFMSKLNKREQAFVLIHEVMHCACLHHTRRGTRDPQLWNIAADFVINDLLIQEGMKMPEGGLHDTKHRGKSAEQVYREVQDMSDKMRQKLQGHGLGDVRDASDSESGGGKPVDASAEEARWKQMLAEAATVAKQQGGLSSNLDRFVQQALQVKCDWREVLQRFMTERAPDDFSWSQPSRRLIGQGVYLPKRLSLDSMGEMVVAIDTSGSMTDELLSQIASEVNSIKQVMNPKALHVVYCDCSINGVETFTESDEVVLRMRGGGGTAFQPVFDWVQEQGVEPRCMVYFTDGYGDFPDKEPDYPVLWGMLKSTVIPPWGEHMEID